MKIKITMKDPDGAQDSIDRAIKESVADIEGLNDREREALIEVRSESLDLSRWLRYGEYVTIEIDTDAGTAIVVPA